eukprot:gene42584-57656_t
MRNASASRYLSLRFPTLSTDRISRWDPTRSNKRPTSDEPLVTIVRRSNAQVLAAVNAPARALGLGPGLPLQDARARVPGVVVHDHDAAADEAQLGAIADWCDRYTPLVGLDGPRGLILDMTGALHLFGGETTLLPAVLARLAEQGFHARGAIASHPGIARAIAGYGAGGIVAPE